MLGKPKYKVGDEVLFEITYNDEKLTLEGKVEIIDSYGTFFDKSDVSYDIMVEDFDNKGKCLCKHIPEKFVHLK